MIALPCQYKLETSDHHPLCSLFSQSDHSPQHISVHNSPTPPPSHMQISIGSSYKSTHTPPVPNQSILQKRRNFIPEGTKKKIATSVAYSNKKDVAKLKRGIKKKRDVEARKLESVRDASLRHYDDAVEALRQEFEYAKRVLQGAQALYSSEARIKAPETLVLQTAPWGTFNSELLECSSAQNTVPLPLLARILSFLPTIEIFSFRLVSRASMHFVQQFVPITANLRKSIATLFRNAHGETHRATIRWGCNFSFNTTSERAIVDLSTYGPETAGGSAPNLKFLQIQSWERPTKDMKGKLFDAVMIRHRRSPLRGLAVSIGLVSRRILTEIGPLVELGISDNFLLDNPGAAAQIFAAHPNLRTIILTIGNVNRMDAFRLVSILKMAKNLRNITVIRNGYNQAMPFFALASLPLRTLSTTVLSMDSLPTAPIRTNFMEIDQVSMGVLPLPYFQHLTSSVSVYHLTFQKLEDIDSLAKYLKATKELRLERVHLHCVDTQRAMYRGFDARPELQRAFEQLCETSVIEICMCGKIVIPLDREALLDSFVKLRRLNPGIEKLRFPGDSELNVLSEEAWSRVIPAEVDGGEKPRKRKASNSVVDLESKTNPRPRKKRRVM